MHRLEEEAKQEPPSISVARHRTAIRRPQLSRPMRLALEDGLIKQDTSLLDYGCGHGDDLRILNNRGIQCFGWDPVHRPNGERIAADIVNLGYVINVIEKVDERIAAIREAWELSRRLLIVSARLDLETKQESLNPYKDGYLTRLGTFQKYYDQQELRSWIDEILSVSSIAAGPGVFYIFRDPALKQSFAASRFRRKVTAPRQRFSDLLFDKYKILFEPLMEFITSRGRLPGDSELEVVPLIRNEVGSLSRAFRIITQVTGEEQWNQFREERSQDLLVYLALSRFGGRPSFSHLPYDLQSDVRAFFSTYKRACSLADELLFSAGNSSTIHNACRKSPVGKLTSEALYIHTSALPYLPSVLRVYEGCARNYIGIIEGANIIKLHCGKPQISYLYYPEFERDPHPSLSASLIVPLNTFHIHYKEYQDSKNPPILHRKETFLALDHPLRPKFERLTRQEEKHNLYDKPELIGTKNGWEKVLNNRGVHISGHRLLHSKVKIMH